jgi:hypothetical protein
LTFEAAFLTKLYANVTPKRIKNFML